MKRLALWVAAFAAIVLVCVGLPGGVTAASVDNFRFSNFKTDYYLSKDDEGRSTMRVVEEFTAEFPGYDQNKGVIRAIPILYDGHPVSPKVVSLTRNGVKEPIYDQEKSDGYLLVSTGDDSYVHGSQTYVLTYTLRDVVKDFGDHQELYWDTNGTESKQSFGLVSATVHIDESIAGNFTGDTACYMGPHGSNTPCGESVETADTAAFSTLRRLGPGQNLSIVLKFDKNTFAPYSEGAVGVVRPVMIGFSLLLSIALLLATVVLFFARGRNAKGRGIIIPEYLPPKDSMRIAANVVNKTAKLIPAQIISLAVAHNIRVIEYDKKGLFGSVTKKYAAELLSVDNLNADELKFVDILFSGKEIGSRYEFDSKDTTVSLGFRSFFSGTAKKTLQEGYRRRIKGTLPILVGIVLAGGFSVIPIIFFPATGDSPYVIIQILPLVLAVAVHLIAIALIVIRRPLTEKGRTLRDYVKGLERYIKLAEADRLRVLQSPEGADKTPIDTSDKEKIVRLYERVLPYAILLGQEKEWAKQLVIYYTDTNMRPDWYMGTGAFNAAAFSHTISGISTAAVSSFGSASSSSSSGFGGGGFSGGGGGGGGFGGR